MPRAVPDADAKIGKKLDYLAATLGQALAPHAFSRKARAFWRETGEGDTQCFYVMEIQGDKWNEGSSGKFFLNMGVQFPALLRALAEVDSAPWLSEGAGTPGTAVAAVRGRLNDALPAVREPWWVAEMGERDFSFVVKHDTDLAALGDVLSKSARAYVLPWLDRHGSLEAALSAARPVDNLFATEVIIRVLLGRGDDAKALFLASGAERMRPEGFDRMKAWLTSKGVDVEAAPAPIHAPDPVPAAALSPRAQAYHEARTRAQAQESLAAQDPAPAATRMPQLLEAFHEACRTRDGAHNASPVWSLLRTADVPTRRLGVLMIMRLLPGANRKVPSLHPNFHADYPSYDIHWGALAAMLLKGLPCDEAFARALFDHVAPLTVRTFESGLFTIDITPPWRHALRYLASEARPWSETFKPQVAQLVNAVQDVALAYFDEQQRGLRKEAVRQGMDPDSVTTNSAELRARTAAYPEQWFEKEERETIGKLRKWLRRDGAGRDVLSIEDDDWGRQLKSAIDTFPGQRAALTGYLESLSSAPPSQYIRLAEGFLATRPAEDNDLASWLRDLLQQYEVSQLQHEWAVTTARPGVGAFAGETSAAILLGLIRLAQVWRPAHFVSVLVSVMEAGMKVVGDVRMRNQKAMTAAVEALAASAEGRATLQDTRSHSKKPVLIKAIDGALAKVTVS